MCPFNLSRVWVPTDTTFVPRDYHLIQIVLPKALPAQSTLNIVLESVQTHATWPWPATAAQNEDQALKYRTGLFVLSPYATAVQRTKLK